MRRPSPPDRPGDDGSSRARAEDTPEQGAFEDMLDEHAEDDTSADDPQGMSAATGLGLLVAAFVGAGVALWAAPRLAPYLPEGVAQALLPQGAALDALEVRLDERESAMAARLSALEAALDNTRQDAAQREASLSALSDTLAMLSRTSETTARQNAETAAAAETSATAATERLDTAETRLTALRARLEDEASAARVRADTLDALAARIAVLEGERLNGIAYATQADLAMLATRGDLEALAADAEEKARDLSRRIVSLRGAVAETGDRVDARREALDDLRRTLAADVAEGVARARGRTATEIAAAREVIEIRIETLRSEMQSEIDRLGDKLASAQRSKADAVAEAQTAAQTAVRDAALRGAAATLSADIRSGRPFAEALGEYRAFGAPRPPEILMRTARAGLSSTEDLARRLPAAARAALEAHESTAAQTTGGHFTSWLRAQVTARPVEEQAGATPAARLSRIEARVREGRLADALAEAERLSPPARRAMAGWIADLRTRLDGERALDAYLALAPVR